VTIQLVYMTTADTDEARRIGQVLVQERLAACVNIIAPMHSIYMWEGALQQSQEAVLLAKTTRMRLGELTARVKALHSYTCPCIVAFDIDGGAPPFLAWIAGEVGAPPVAR